MRFEKGFKFLTVNAEYEVIEFIERHNMYRLKNITENIENDLMTHERIQNYVDDIESIKIRREKNRLYREKCEAYEKAEAEREFKTKQEYEFCFGYCDNKTAMQKGKILKALNKTIAFNNKAITRKDFIHLLIKESDTVELKIVNNTNRYSSKKIELEYKKLVDKKEYRIYTSIGTYEITKTEYDYAEYLIKNNIIIPEAV